MIHNPRRIAPINKKTTSVQLQAVSADANGNFILVYRTYESQGPSTNRYVNIRYPHYDHFVSVLHDGPLNHLLNHDSYTIPEQTIEGGYFGPTCLIHWFHIFVTKQGVERQFEFGVCRVKDEPDLPLHVATLAPPYSTRPFRPKPSPKPG
jgi:hypothetical protein